MEKPKLDLKRAVSISEALDMVPDTHLAPLVEYIEQLEKELDERDAHEATPAPGPEIEGLVRMLLMDAHDLESKDGLASIHCREAASALTAIAGELREARAEIERHLKDKSDWATKWEAEHNSYLDQRDRVTELTAEVERLRGALTEGADKYDAEGRDLRHDDATRRGYMFAARLVRAAATAW